jgi:ABC-type transport system involved in multi-copper enzyme maturation permease subunit
MAVYKRSYSSYAGPVTSPVTRVLVLTRYGLAEAWASKITVGLFTLCWLPCLLSIFGIYLANNPLARAMIAGRGGEMLTINANYFLKVLSGQCWLALVLAAWVAPRLITFDLADNALPILLSHPISRVGYFCGKFLALFASLSAVTWGPCLLLFAYQGYASPTPWALNHLRIAAGLVAGAVIWIAFLSVLGLALKSWYK